MEDTFDIKKIEAAIRRANNSVIDYEKLTDKQIDEISKNVEVACENMKRSPSVEEIQDMVESVHLMWRSTILHIVTNRNWCASPTQRMNRS